MNGDKTPTPDGSETTIQNTDSAVDHEDAVAALRDILRFYNRRVDDDIPDHTETGEHSERPTTAREYFTEVRGWSDDTVDDLLLGWAPGDHVDQLVAYLHDRGHSREAMLATGAIGESDSGSLYTTFTGRYVLPYYDADGEPAYAIARCTSGDGGGARGYGGHPADYQVGKYAKLRHTDDRVPFEEPIYGLGTLDQGDHVVVAEGIADAITAREAGYAVLSPVAKEFKNAHLDPFADALEAHAVSRITIVADADSIRGDAAVDADPESIVEAAGVLAPTGAGLAGALRTASKLGGRTDANLRVVEPPAPADTENDLDEFVTGPWAGDLDALLRSAKPASAFDELEFVTRTTGSTEEAAEFDAEEYEPTATEADETTDDIQDIYHALNRLDAQRVAEDTIVSEWLESPQENRAFRPTWASSDYTGTAVFANSEVFKDGGGRGGKGGPAVMAAIDAGLVRDTQCPDAVEGETWVQAVDHLRNLGYSIPRLETNADSEEHTETPRDILALDVVVEPAHALAAAAAVEPDDLDTPLPELQQEGVDDVAVAVAHSEGMIADASEFPADGDYTEAYYRARDHYGAPLPKYLDNSTLEERADLCIAAVKRVEPKHILDAVDSKITVESPSGKPTAKLNPTWEDSESGERILAGYGRGFYCVEHKTSFSPIQLVALEHGYIDSEDAYPRGEAFKQSYRLLREEYGAPLPKWRATLLEHVAVLPPSVRVLQGSAVDKDLDEVYAETEALLRDALSVRDRAQLVTVVPNGGKTFSVAKIADEQPVLYTAERNDLKQQMADYAAEIREDDGMDAEPTIKHLPILAEKTIDDAVLAEAAGEIRENGRWLLRDRDELLDRVGGYLGEQFEDDADEEGDLDRANCPVASGEHGEAWALAVQTARSLGHEPSKIHHRDTALFGEALPCQEGTAECPYTEAWNRIRQPENQADILIGSPGHAYVDSATTYFDTDENGDRVEKPRSVVVDEFLGDAYMNDYGKRSVDHAVWAAEALFEVDNREDLLAAELDTDTWVDCWLDGEGDEYQNAGEIVDFLEAGAALCEAAENAERVLEDGLDATASTVNIPDLRDALEALTGEDADLSSVDDTLSEVIDQLGADADQEYAIGDAETAGQLYDLLDSLETIHEGVIQAVGASGGRPLEAQLRDAVEGFRAGGDLRALLLEAADAIAEGEPVGLIHAARTALCGGREGCRELAVFADDGYAHPDAWALLAGVIATDTAEVDTATFAFDGDDGGVFKRLDRNGATIIADKNHHGAIVVDPLAFTDITGGKCPVVGLDATARPELWRLALGRDTERRDIHDSPAERRRFLREVMNLRVIQTSNDPLPYHGDPEGKNFGEDIELVRTVAEKYTGDHADAVDDDDPAVISTLKVIEHLKESLKCDTSDLINYENMKGSDALGDRQVAVVLGSCHYGDAKPEKWGLLAGEDAGRGDSRGDRLDYESDVANTYLAHMREDYTMQAILRAGRNDAESVVFAHTSALREDLPVEDEAAVLSVHSKGTLAVAEAASEFTERAFTAPEIADELGDDSIGLRQIQNVLADLRENGYLRVENDGGRGNAFEYSVEEDPGLAEVNLPGGESLTDSENEISRMKDQYTWNFVFDRDNSADSGVIPPNTPEIPATDTTAALVDTADPPS